jgi:2-C-methyl-D-erythritol 4-phosphate cytidylyltransferase
LRGDFVKLVTFFYPGDPQMAKFAVLLLAAGKSSRFHDKNYKKPYAPLADRAVWLHTIDRFTNRSDVAQTIVVIDSEDREMFHTRFGANLAILGVDLAIGGQQRSDSVAKGLEKVHDDIDFVAIHDAVRPCLADKWIDDVFSAAEKSGAAILATPITSTLKRANPDGSTVAETVDRQRTWLAQTPQVFRRQIIMDAYARRGDEPATDDAQLVERIGQAVTLVAGSPLNIKITTREDLRMAAAALKALPKPKLSGPAHPFSGDDMWR